jgi:hypothetical protein
MNFNLVRTIWGVIAIVAFTTFAPAQREKSVLMPADVAKYMHPRVEAGMEAPTWEPTTEELSEMEYSFEKLAVLKPDRDCCRRSSFLFKPDEYYMQYAAVFLDGHAYIYINAFRETPKTWQKAWRKDWIMIKGGGHDFWQALYDPANKSFSKLTFNADE